MDMSELQRKRVLKRWKKNDELEAGRSISDKVERNRLLATLIAYLQGDGSVSARKHKNITRYDISFYPDDMKVAQTYANIYKSLYGRAVKIKPLKNYFKIRTTHKAAYNELSKITTFRSLDWRMPLEILDTLGKKYDWIRAFFDCEAYVGKRTIVVQSVNKAGLEDISLLLEELGINSRIYRYQRAQQTWNTNYLLVISRKEDRQSFLKRIGFNHSRKQTKLENSLAGVA